MSLAVTGEFPSSKAIISCLTVPFLSGGTTGSLVFFIDNKNSFTSDYDVFLRHYNGRVSAALTQQELRQVSGKKG